MIRVADYIAKYIKKVGIKDVFLVTGGGAMYLNDAFGKEDLYFCNHHEQACAIAAEGYARMNNFLGVCNVTTGPGATNAITGVMGAWTDSIPMLVISGQVKQSVSLYQNKGYRQLGTQELPIIDVVKPITKYATPVLDPYDIAYELEKAIYLANHGRHGPVWLDIPLDVQNSQIDIGKLKHFVMPKNISVKTDVTKDITKVLQMLRKAKRPLIVAGYGVRSSGALKDFYRFIDKFKIPVVTAIQANDLMWEKNNLFAGRFGIFGTRPGNFAIQNADLLIILGCRLHVIDTGYDFETFSRESKKILVEIDETELKKPYVKLDLPIHTDIKIFLDKILKKDIKNLPSYSWWVKKCLEWRKKYPACLPEYKKTKKGVINSYCFIDELSRSLKNDDVVVTANGTAYTCTAQGIKLKKGQRLIYNTGCASMGYDLPAAIGISMANKRKRTVLITGDGSIQMNLQELQTIVYHKLPIKIFVFNNNGYLAIRITQGSFFHRFYGIDSKTGVSFPDLKKIAKAYGIKFLRINSLMGISKKINETLNSRGPCICEIMMSPDQRLIPKPSSVSNPDGTFTSKPLEDTYPFLDRKEFLENMIIKPVKTDI